MSPEELKKLRQDLSCSASELARALGVEAKTVVQWESGELFPTKRHVEQMKKLLESGPGAIPKLTRSKDKGATGMAKLADPKLWEIVRKLSAHPALFAEVSKLAAAYDDPAD